MSDPKFGIRDYLDAKFEGINKRFDAQDARLTKIENAGPRAGAFGAAGTILGAALVAVLAFFGIKLPGQGQQ